MSCVHDLSNNEKIAADHCNVNVANNFNFNNNFTALHQDVGYKWRSAKQTKWE
jgi:hypothetical protein